MKEKRKERKGVLSKLIEKGIEIFLKKECRMIKNININISSSNREIIKGEINEMKITAEEVNYKELIFNNIELQTSKLGFDFQIINKQLKSKDNFLLKMKITLTGESLNKMLNSQNWDWIGCLISQKLLNLSQFTDLQIENNIIKIKGSNKDKTNHKTELVKIKSKEGKIHLKNIDNMYSMTIPIEENIYINHINIIENKININAQSEASI